MKDLFSILILIAASAFFLSFVSGSIENHKPLNGCSLNDSSLSIATAGTEFKNSFTLPNNPYKLEKIVIDAGHGGKDSGCRGKYSLEKNIALNIAKEFGKRINESHPEVEVIYTRESDVFIPLFKRIDIANKNKADLFISIHCNYVARNTTSGTETFVMGLHRAEENLLVAKRENASILLEQNYQENYDGYDPNSPEGHIILSMFQNAYLDQSIHLANIIETSFAKRSGMKSRGVKQAGFMVLRKATMPSVLVEAGFLSNSKEEKYLLSTKGQKQVADVLLKAFTEYKRSLDQESDRMEEVITENKMNIEIPKVEKSRVIQPQIEQTEIVETINKREAPAQKQNHDPISISNELVYKVQLAASLNKPLSLQEPLLSVIDEVEIRKEDNMYKYLFGNYQSLQNASEAKTKLTKRGFKGAFIVAYKGLDRVKI